MQTRVAYLNIK